MTTQNLASISFLCQHNIHLTYEKYPAMPSMLSRVNRSPYSVIPLCYLYFFHLAQYIAHISATKLNKTIQVRYLSLCLTHNNFANISPSLSPESLSSFSLPFREDCCGLLCPEIISNATIKGVCRTLLIGQTRKLENIGKQNCQRWILKARQRIRALVTQMRACRSVKIE